MVVKLCESLTYSEQQICASIYKYKVSIDCNLNWMQIKGSVINQAIQLAKNQCQSESIRFDLNAEQWTEMVEWRLCHVHRTAQKKSGRYKGAGPSKFSSVVVLKPVSSFAGSSQVSNHR